MKYIKYTINEMIAISEADFISKLFEHTENRTISKATNEDQAKIDSWKDCRRFLQKYISNEDAARIGDVSICFEYQIFDGSWIDAIIVCNEKLIILEFKSGIDHRQETLDGHRSQVIGYYNKITRCNRVIWEELKRNEKFSVEKYLVYTNPQMAGVTADLDYIVVDDEFTRVVQRITEPASEKRVEALLEFDEELDVTTTGVMRDILNRRVLSDMYVQDDNVTACANIVEAVQANDDKLALNLVFIKGAPGTGKTGTGFSLLERYIHSGAKYVTGNGNLAQIFKQMIRQDEIGGTEAAVVGSLHDLYHVSDFCEKYQEHRDIALPGCPNKILIIDEAQRVWNPTQIALAKKNKLSQKQQAFIIEHEVSEAMLVLRAVLKDLCAKGTSRTVVFLMGSGQEIYIGEEDGEAYIRKAVEHIKNTIEKMSREIEIKIYVPTEDMKVEYEGIGETCEIHEGLLLSENKRNTYNNGAQNFVNELLSDVGNAMANNIADAFYIYNDYASLLRAVEPIKTNAFTVGIVGCGFDTNTRWVPGRNGKNVPQQYLNLNGQEILNIENRELMDFYINKASNNLNKFASQFNCQGLELDYVIMVWGSMMLRKNGKWVLSNQAIWAVDNYCDSLEELKIEYPRLSNVTIDREKIKNTFIRNSYRVLLTRARISTYVFVEDTETYEYLKGLL